MMKKKTIVLAIVLSLLFGLLALPSMASSHKISLSPEFTPWSTDYFSVMSQITFTPVTTIYLPIVAVSFLQLPPDPFPQPPPPMPGSHGVIGKITFRDGQNTYAVGEKVFVNITATNTLSGTISFGILGLVSSLGSFQSSWTDGSIAPGETFQLEDGLAFSMPGVHKLWLTMCFSSLPECQGPNGDWERFEPGLDVVVQ